MRKILIFLFISYALIFISSCKKDDLEESDYNLLSKEEKAMIDEMNYARTKPKEYAEKFLKPLYDKADKSKTTTAGTYDEGVISAYEYMIKMNPIEKLEVEAGLVMAVRDFIADPKRIKGQAHSTNGPGNSLTLSRYYSEEKTVGGSNEIYAPLGQKTDCKSYHGGSRTTILDFIIDTGNKQNSWGHRMAILKESNKKVGFATGKLAVQTPLWHVYVSIGAFSTENYKSSKKIEDDYNWKPSEITWNSNHKPISCPV